MRVPAELDVDVARELDRVVLVPVEARRVAVEVARDDLPRIVDLQEVGGDELILERRVDRVEDLPISRRQVELQEIEPSPREVRGGDAVGRNESDRGRGGEP